jgi:hypothetical protein
MLAEVHWSGTHMIKPVVATVAVFVAVVAASDGQLPTSAPDVQTVGPQVGAKVPSFALPDQTGTARSLESLMGPKGAIVVFFRSADW